jgi:hypothetical protein
MADGFAAVRSPAIGLERRICLFFAALVDFLKGECAGFGGKEEGCAICIISVINIIYMMLDTVTIKW